ncbi:hypothetical protein SDC9_86893 [bioreactor metagenome]|uniref:Uncharacterized protein n=1 Tax=bioreactor metagenome TaxID=1076179 RepID=A0A644ZNH7_9ZZZZ|nr:MAG: Phage tail repeat like protein [Lentisphaerae bacterium ADurb.Bin242]
MGSTYDSLLGELRETDAAPEEVGYTINGDPPDENGNFAISAEGIGAAESGHRHDIADVENLPESLDGKSDTGHTHELVSGITVDGQTVSGELTLEPSGNLLVSAAGQVLTLTPEPFAADATASVADANTANAEPLKVFSGTQAEWDAFTKETGVRYLVFIRD